MRGREDVSKLGWEDLGFKDGIKNKRGVSMIQCWSAAPCSPGPSTAVARRGESWLCNLLLPCHPPGWTEESWEAHLSCTAKGKDK